VDRSPARVVAEGYDIVADRYLAWTVEGPTRLTYLDRLLGMLRDGSDVLELGCGAGEPVARRLSEHHRVTGVDLSPEQIVRARARVPDADFLIGDMTQLVLEPASFDAVVAFYSIIHVPRTQHTDLFQRIASWLRPDGVLLVTMGAGDSPGTVEDEWLGVPMYFSHFDAPTNRSIVQRAGFVIESAEVVEDDEDGRQVAFQWIIARRGIEPEMAR
jgi:cyclopropane fatty-acyl-phospholipid synthase-like methyltransferase